MRIGILTGGGDCPGLNGVIRAVTKTARNVHGATVIGIEDGFEGLVEGRMRELGPEDVSGILGLGGTILGTSNKGDPWHYPVGDDGAHAEVRDRAGQALHHYAQWKLDALVAVGGDGTMHIADRLARAGARVIGVPKTIDNDVPGTDVTFGFDTASAVVGEAIDRLATTASSHHRVMVVETMGRYAGWIALMGGVAGGADLILIPEIPFDWPAVFAKVNERQARGKRFTMVCVAEGARLPDGSEVVAALDARRTDAKRLGGIGQQVAQAIEQGTGHDARLVVLGHLQRGGPPTAADRVLATTFGCAAAHAACRGEAGVMVAMRGGLVVPVPIAETVKGLRQVPPDHPVVISARAVGTSFGDA
jgi:phosphofructokinase-like protein